VPISLDIRTLFVLLLSAVLMAMIRVVPLPFTWSGEETSTPPRVGQPTNGARSAVQ
jgi:hypothetical protein